MNKKLFNVKSRAKWLSLATLGGGLVATLPLIAIACGESDKATPTTPITPTTVASKVEATTFLGKEVKDNAKVAAISTPERVTWGTVPALSTTLSEHFNAPTYSTQSYADEAAALADTIADNWKLTLPTTLNADSTKRFLWVRLVPKLATQASQAAALDLTKTSGIEDVKASVTFDAKVYLENTVAKGAVASTASRVSAVTWQSVPALPAVATPLYEPVEYSEYNFTRPEDAQADKATPTRWSKDLPTKVDADSTKRFLWARLVNKNDTTKTVVHNLTTSSGVTLIKADSEVVADKDTAYDFLDKQVKDNAKVVAGSNTADVTWGVVPALPTTLAKYSVPSYSVKFFASEADALKSTTTDDWSTELPKVLNADKTQRYLWVRLVDAATSANSVARELTQPSGIEDVKTPTEIKALGTAFLKDVLDPSVKVKVADSTPSSLEWNAYSALTDELKLYYSSFVFSTTKYTNDQAALDALLTDYLSSLPGLTNSDKTLRALWARLVPIKATVESVVRDLTTSSEIDKVEAPVDYKALATAFLKDSVAPAVKANTTTSTTSAVNWGTVPSITTELTTGKYSAPEFSTTYYADDTAALDDTNVDHWKGLPTTLNTVVAQRYLYVRLVNTGDSAKTVVRNLKASSDIDNVSLDYVALATAFLKDSVAPAVKANLETSTYAEVVWGTAPDLTPELSAQYNALEYSVTYYPDDTTALGDTDADHWKPLPTTLNPDSALRYLWARLVNKNDTSKTVVRELTADSGIVDVKYPANSREAAVAFLTDFATKAKVNVDASLPDDVVWNELPTLPAELSAHFFPISYEIVAYNDETTALATPGPDWTTTIPASFTGASTTRALWVRLTNADSTKSAAVNLSDSSGIKDVKSAAEVNNHASALAFLRRLADTVKVDTTASTSASLTWSAPLPLTKALSENYDLPLYSTFNFNNEDDAVRSDPKDWSRVLPTTLDGNTTRSLWVRIGNRMLIENSAAFELSDTSGIKDVPSA